MTHPLTAATAGLSLAALLAVGAAAETVTLQGTVAERFGPKFVLETGDGRVLVDGGPDWRGDRGPGLGAAVTVTGQQDAAGLLASRILLSGGREIVIAQGPEEVDALDPAAMAALTDQLAEAGIGAPRLVSTTSRHGHFEADAPEGTLHLQARRDGVLRRAEGPGVAALAPGWALDAAEAEGIVAVEALRFTSRHVHLAGPNADGQAQRVRVRRDEAGRAQDPSAPPEAAELRRIVEAAGYDWEGGLSLHRAHAEVDALNPEGEPVRLRLDRDGEITRERARR
ncbi:MAG: hypothetical protein ACXIUV_01165 [Alkalilacustris sp.]